MIDRHDIKRIIDERESGAGFSIEDDDALNGAYERGIERLSAAIEKWTEEHEPAGAWSHKGDTPMLNSGYHFANDTFIASSYDWSDDPMDLNFHHYESGIDISWYKHAWRGPYGHSKETLDALVNGSFEDVIDDCISSLSDTEENELSWY